MSANPRGWSLPRAIGRFPKQLAGGGAKFFRDLGTLVTGQVASKLIGLFAFAYLARVLSTTSYGDVEFIIGLAGLFGTVIDLGLGTIGIRRAGADPAKRGELAAEILVIRIAIALVCGLVMVVGIDLFGGSSELRALALLYAVSLVVGAAYQEWLLQSAGLMTSVALAQVLRMAVFLASLLLLVRGVGDTALAGAAEIAGIAAAACFAMYVQSRKITPIRLWTRFDAGSLIREGIPVALGTLLWSAAQYAPLFLMGALKGGAGLGFFAGASRLATSIAAFSSVYHFNLYATASRLDRKGTALATVMASSFRTTAWVTIGGALFVALAAAPIVTSIFGHDFGPAAPTLAILIWTVPAMFLSGHARWSLILAHREADVLRSQAAGLLTAIALGLALVPAYSATGAAIAAVGGNIGVWISSHELARRRGVKTPPIMLALKPLLLAGALALLGATLTGLSGWVEAVAAAVLYALIAPIVDRALSDDILHLARVGGDNERVVE